MNTRLQIDRMENGFMVTVVVLEQSAGPKNMMLAQMLGGPMDMGQEKQKHFVFEQLEDALVFAGSWFQRTAASAEAVE